MKYKSLAAAIFLLLVLYGSAFAQARVGAICKDKTSSTTTGRGVCAGHGGVDHWLYSEPVVTPTPSTVAAPTATSKPLNTPATKTNKVVLVPTATSAAAISATSVTTTGTVLSNSNLRNGPGTNFGIVGKVTAGQVVTITESNTDGGWYHLDSNAWIAAFLVETKGAISTSPSATPTKGTGVTQPTATSTKISTSVPAVAPATATPVPQPATSVPAPTKQASKCDPSYPDFCIPPAPPDLNCGDIPQKGFTVLPPDPHGFDRDGDGIGCKS